jgi:hypothetical protein
MKTSFSRERGLLRQHGRSPGLSFKPSCRAFPSGHPAQDSGLQNAAFVALTVAGQQRTSWEDEAGRAKNETRPPHLPGHLFPYGRLQLNLYSLSVLLLIRVDKPEQRDARLFLFEKKTKRHHSSDED